jgi:hypothetical protein
VLHGRVPCVTEVSAGFGTERTTDEGRFPVAHVPKAKAAVSRGLEALILAQSDVPTTGALNLMMKWEKVVAEGKSDAFAVCCTCILQNCGFYCCYSRVDRVVCSHLLCCCVFDWPTVCLLNRLG